MTTRRVVRIAMNGVTGRMGYRQHLVGSILAIRARGGVPLPDGGVIWPEPVLVGRDAAKLSAIAARHGLEEWTTSLSSALADTEIYFDAQITSARPAAVRAAIAAGKHIYAEKPLASSLAEAVELSRLVAAAGLRAGVVQDKLFLPGIIKLRRLIEGGVLGRVLSVRGEFGYWVFDGSWQPAQRPSWNYRSDLGGGIILDMFPHWRYLLDHVVAPVRTVYAAGATHIPVRHDESGQRYAATADDAAYAILELDGGAVAQVNSSWAVRVYRDELVEFQVDGTDGSAVAGLQECRLQHRGSTPRPQWNPDAPAVEDFRSQWQRVPANAVLSGSAASGSTGSASTGSASTGSGSTGFDGCFLSQWELFLLHVVTGKPYPHDFLDGARGVQLAELGVQSWREGRRLEIPPLAL